MSRSFLKIACLFLLGTSVVLADTDTLWTQIYSGPYGGDDAARVVLTDTFGNIVVVGSSAGESGSGGYDMVVIKYSWFHGNQLWVKRITGADTSDDVAMDAARDPVTGMIMVTGQTGNYPDYNFLTVQLDPNGSEVWDATYDGTAHAGDVAKAVAVDTSGSIFVAGYAQNATTDFVTIKYNWDGSRAWVKTYDGGGDEAATDIALGPDGSVFVTGSGGDNYITVKYSSAGDQEWAAAYNGPGNTLDEAVAIAVDSSGSAYVTGSSLTGSPPNTISHIATVKYDSTGTQQWAVLYPRERSSPAALALGASALYVAGKTASDLLDDDFVTIAYDYGTGDTLWARRDSGPSGSNDAAVGIALGPDSAIWVGGSSNYDYMTMLYTPDGVEHKVEMYGSPGDDQMAAITVDAKNQVTVTGNTWAGTGYDILTVKIDTLGPGVAEPPAREPFSGLRFSVTPNPSASGLATLRFGPVNSGTADVTVSGVDGRIALSRSVETYGTEATYPLDVRKLEAGVYIVRLESGGRSATRKLVIGR